MKDSFLVDPYFEEIKNPLKITKTKKYTIVKIKIHDLKDKSIKIFIKNKF